MDDEPNKYSELLDIYSDFGTEIKHTTDLEYIPDDDHKYFDLIYNMATRLQDYCKEQCLPIFNKIDTTSIIMNTFI